MTTTTPPTCPKCGTTDCRSMWLEGELIVSSTCMERQIAKLTSELAEADEAYFALDKYRIRNVELSDQLAAALTAKEGAERELAEGLELNREMKRLHDSACDNRDANWNLYMDIHAKWETAQAEAQTLRERLAAVEAWKRFELKPQ